MTRKPVAMIYRLTTVVLMHAWFDTVFNTNGFATVMFNFVKQKVLSKRTLKLSCLVIPVSGNYIKQ